MDGPIEEPPHPIYKIAFLPVSLSSLSFSRRPLAGASPPPWAPPTQPLSHILADAVGLLQGWIWRRIWAIALNSIQNEHSMWGDGCGSPVGSGPTWEGVLSSPGSRLGGHCGP